jgi:hypothetical protein
VLANAPIWRVEIRGSRPSVSLQSNREKTRSGPVCLIAIDVADKCPADFVRITESVAPTGSEE